MLIVVDVSYIGVEKSAKLLLKGAVNETILRKFHPRGNSVSWEMATLS